MGKRSDFVVTAVQWYNITMTKEQGIDRKIARQVGTTLGTLGFYSHILTQHLSQFGQEAMLHLNPFSATTAQMQERHPKSWTGISLRQTLKEQGVSEGRLQRVERATGKDLDMIYSVGEAKALPGVTGQNVAGRFKGDADHGVYVEVDGKEDIHTARYFIGLKGLQSGGISYSWEEISSSMQ